MLEASLGILDRQQCSYGSLESLTANRAGSYRWSSPEMFYDPKSTFCHAQSFILKWRRK
jgi:hypothetical protein